MALASINTLGTPVAKAHEQLPLFDAGPAIDPKVALAARPQDELLKELHETGVAIAIARNGTAVVVRREVRMGLRYIRSVAEKEKALLGRGHDCQICDFSFLKHHGRPYAEVHHIVPVSEGGDDVQENLLVLCSNHHRQLHFARVELPVGTSAPERVVINSAPCQVRWP